MDISDSTERKDDLKEKPSEAATQDVVFGEITEGGPNYRNVHLDHIQHPHER